MTTIQTRIIRCWYEVKITLSIRKKYRHISFTDDNNYLYVNVHYCKKMYHVIQKTCSINHWKMNGCYGCKHQITENKITRLMIQISSIFLPNTWHVLSYNISDFHGHNIQCNAIHIVPFLKRIKLLTNLLFLWTLLLLPLESFLLPLSLFSLGLPQQVD